jgi:hypothetical protein
MENIRADHPVLGPLFVLAQIDNAEFARESESLLQRLSEAEEGLSDGQINPLVKLALGKQPPRSRADVARCYGDLLAHWYEQSHAADGDETPRADLPPAAQQLLQLLLSEDSPTNIARENVASYFNRAERNRLREFEKKIQAHKVDSPGAPPRAMVVQDASQLHDPRVFIRGNPARPGDPVPRQSLLVLAGDQRKPFASGSGRLELAHAVADPENPLTWRVFVNRVWMHHFGEPLVETPSDFGLRTPPPRQGPLLDYLAWSLISQGGSLKSLHREILLSSTYRQASTSRAGAAEVDPENRLYWRMNRRRLEFEALRDAVLHVTQKLDLDVGGRPVDITTPPFSRRRTLYGYIDRQDLPNLLRAFDFANPDQSQAKRPRTTVPQQALFFMNSPFVIEQARYLADQLDGHDEADLEKKIQTLYHRVLARSATDDEVKLGFELVNSTAAGTDVDASLSPWQQYCHLLLMTNEFVFVD